MSPKVETEPDTRRIEVRVHHSYFDEDLRRYYLPQQISAYRTEYSSEDYTEFRFPPYTVDSKEEIKEKMERIGPIGRKVVEGLSKIKGVKEIIIDRDSISVDRAHTCPRWSVIEPEIASVFALALKIKEVVLVDPDPIDC